MRSVRLERIAEAVGPDAPADALAADRRRLGASRTSPPRAPSPPTSSPSPTGCSRSGPVRRAGRRLAGPADGGRGRTAGRELTPRETGEAIAAVADRVVTEAVAAAEPGLPFAVVGMGKLGAKELNVASDLDLLFVYDEGEGPDVGAATAAGERGDAPRPRRRLGARRRPPARGTQRSRSHARWPASSSTGSGTRSPGSSSRSCGPATSPGRRARPAVRAERGGLRVPARRAHARPRGRGPPDARADRARAREAAGGVKFHFKLGVGSLADVQFAVELSLMRFGGAEPEVRSRRTLERSSARRRSAPGGSGRPRPRRGVRVPVGREERARDGPSGPRRILPGGAGEQTALARRLGFEEYPRQAFLEQYLHVTRRCRRAMERCSPRRSPREPRKVEP